MTTCYRCEKCGKIYTNEAECAECEGMHVEPLFMAAPRWQQRMKYPDTVHIAFSNGTSALYGLIGRGENSRQLADWQVQAMTQMAEGDEKKTGH